MGVYLRFVFDTGGGQAETFYGPAQVFLCFLLPERHAFVQGRFVDLDNADSAFFQILHFIADGEGELFADFRPRQVVAYKTPAEYGFFSGQAGRATGSNWTPNPFLLNIYISA